MEVQIIHLDQLRAAGVDMEKKESVEEALKIFKELVDKLEKEYSN